MGCEGPSRRQAADISVAMATTITGGVEDHILIMDMLGDYLFPMGERKIAEFMVAGVSLGGHLIWRLLKAGEFSEAPPLCQPEL